MKLHSPSLPQLFLLSYDKYFDTMYFLPSLRVILISFLLHCPANQYCFRRNGSTHTPPNNDKKYITDGFKKEKLSRRAFLKPSKLCGFKQVITVFYPAISMIPFYRRIGPISGCQSLTLSKIKFLVFTQTKILSVTIAWIMMLKSFEAFVAAFVLLSVTSCG